MTTIIHFYILLFLVYNVVLSTIAKPTESNTFSPDVKTSPSSKKRNIFIVARVYKYTDKYEQQKKSLSVRTGGTKEITNTDEVLSGDTINLSNLDQQGNGVDNNIQTTQDIPKFDEKAPTDGTFENKVDDTPSTSSPITTITTNKETSKTEETDSVEKPTNTDHCKCSCEKEKSPPVKEEENDTEGVDLKRLINFKPPVTSLTNDELHYQLADYIIKFVFKHYPELQIPLLAKVLANGTTHRAYSGMIMEFQQPNNFDILVTDSYSQVNDGTTRKIEQYPSLYQCSKAIRYCSVSPKFCQYQEGDYDTNIIITVPHGGNFKPEYLRERSTGCYDNNRCVYIHDCEQYGGTKDKDRCGVETHPNTDSRNIALLLADRIKNETGQRPHVVIMELHHSIIDVDAYKDEGTFGDGQMETTWYDFHNFISIAKQKIKGRGILLDIHTHSKQHGLVELGYAVSKSQLERDEVDPSLTSIKSLAEYIQVPFDEVLRGKSSLGDILLKKNIEAFPSSKFQKPSEELLEDRETIAKLYGSHYGGLVDAIRISTPKKYYTKNDVEEYTTLLSSALKEYMDLNYIRRGYIP